MIDVDRLATVAMGLAVRVRDDNPDSNLRWLRSQIDTAEDLTALVFILAAAVPIEVPWSLLTEWAQGPVTWEMIQERRRILNEAIGPKRRIA